jgi:hypothetical protein
MMACHNGRWDSDRNSLSILFILKGFCHPHGSQQSFLNGLAPLYNVVPYQRRAKHARQCGVKEGGRLPTRDWLLNLQILTSGGFQ